MGTTQTKGREWLENSVASNLPQPQAIAYQLVALDNSLPEAKDLIYDLDSGNYQFARYLAQPNNAQSVEIESLRQEAKQASDYFKAKLKEMKMEKSSLVAPPVG